MNVKQIFENNRNWIAKKLQSDDHYFEKLAKKQKPEFLYIGCSDSRVSTEELMGLQPGQVFVHPILLIWFLIPTSIRCRLSIML